MAKKIYDIKPPAAAKKSERPKKVTSKSVTIIKRKQVSQPIQPKRQEKKLKGNRKPVVITILVVILVIAIYLFFKLPKAEITLWPKVDAPSFQQIIVADRSEKVADADKLVIPAEYFESIKTAEQDFPSTGIATDAGKAQGTITIYNKYNPPKALTLRTGTHFLSDSGKLFIISKQAIVPAGKKSGSKITPGSIAVAVTAVESGTDYNIPPSNFSVPGLKGTDYYYSIYAESKDSMDGGYTGKVKKVTSDDIEGAKDVLSDKATTSSIDDIKSQMTEGHVLLNDAITSEITEVSTTVKVGSIADEFNYGVSVKTRALVFEKSDLDELAKNYILSKVPTGKTLLEESYKIDYTVETIDISEGKITLKLNFSGGVYQDVDKNLVALSLMGQKENQIRQIISDDFGENISKVDVKFWPFWVNSAPKNQKSVSVDLKF